MTVRVTRASIGWPLLLSALVASCAAPGSTPRPPAAQPATAAQRPTTIPPSTATIAVAPAPTARPTASPTVPPATPPPRSTSGPAAASAESTRLGVLRTGTPVVLPGVALLSAPGGRVLWALVGGPYLFRSLDGGTTWE
jgi:hypothetical protein